MKAALVVMTIMGCDDSVTHCHYIDTVGERWQTVALCDGQAETHINRHQAANYPVIVAVCESADDRMSAEMDARAPAETATDDVLQAESVEARPGLASRTLDIVKKAIPDRAALMATVTTPVRYAEEGYSWVVKRFVD